MFNFNTKVLNMWCITVIVTIASIFENKSAILSLFLMCKERVLKQILLYVFEKCLYENWFLKLVV